MDNVEWYPRILVLPKPKEAGGLDEERGSPNGLDAHDH